MKNIILFTAGSGSREILLTIHQINRVNPTWKVLGFVDEDANIIGKKIDGYNVYEPNDNIIKHGIYGVCGLLDPIKRQRIIEKFILSKDLKLASIIAPSVAIPVDMQYGKGTVILPSVDISFGVKLDECVFVLWGSILGHHLHIGSYSTILTQATITGGCNIGKRVIIGARSILNVGVKIGNDSIVGIGTTVIKNIEKNKIIINIPREIINDN